MKQYFINMGIKGVQFAFGGGVYGIIEILFRGYTHISMILTGGFCFLLILKITGQKWRLPLKALAGGGCITLVEFIVGCVVNVWLRLEVWDYSNIPFNILGQICPLFFVIWCGFCFLLIPAIHYIRSLLFQLIHKEKWVVGNKIQHKG